MARLSRRVCRKLDRLLRADRAASVAHLLAKHDMRVDTVLSGCGGGSVLHQICRRRAVSVFWSMCAGIVAAACCVTDRRGRTPAHRAVSALLKCRDMSVYTGLVQPLADICPAAFTTADVCGQRPLQLLRACRQLSTAASMLSRQLATAGGAASGSDREHGWSQKLLDEQHYESRHFDKLERDFSDVYNEGESFDQWTERIHSEYHSKHSRARHTTTRTTAAAASAHGEERTYSQPQYLKNSFNDDPGVKDGDADDVNASPHRPNNENSQNRTVDSSHSLSADCKLFASFQLLHQLISLSADSSRDGRTSCVTAAHFQLLATLRDEDVRRLVAWMTSSGDVTSTGGVSSSRRVVCELLRVWHPDKSVPRLAELFNSSEQDSWHTLQASVVRFVQQLNALL